MMVLMEGNIIFIFVIRMKFEVEERADFVKRGPKVTLQPPDSKNTIH